MPIAIGTRRRPGQAVSQGGADRDRFEPDCSRIDECLEFGDGTRQREVAWTRVAPQAIEHLAARRLVADAGIQLEQEYTDTGVVGTVAPCLLRRRDRLRPLRFRGEQARLVVTHAPDPMIRGLC